MLIISVFLLSVWGAKPLLNSNTTVIYWGQDSVWYSSGNKLMQSGLREYCTDASDIIILSFCNKFGSGRSVGLNFANLGEYPADAADIKLIGDDIKYCQSKGKTILLSMGGAEGQYGFSSAADAESVAVDFHNMFGTGVATEVDRPFGDAVIDGYDLDIENWQGSYYENFVDKIKSLDAGMIIGAAPQCPYPDGNLGTVLNKSFFDYCFVQFYNTPYCSPLYNAQDSQWSWGDWINWAVKTSINKDVRVFLGTPGCPIPDCAGSSYLGFEHLKEYIDKCIAKGQGHFGGVMMWDASAAFENVQNGVNFVQYAKNLLNAAA